MPRRLLSGLWALLAAGGLTGCADKRGSVEAATALAEAVYPGQLELFDTHMQKAHYDVVFAVKGDAFSRVRLAVDSDPAQCRPGTPCEDRLRRAYTEGTQAGAKLKALNAALPGCGATLLAVHGNEVSPTFRAVVEMDLDPADQQPALDRLTPCIAAFRAALPADATDEQRRLNLRIFLSDGGKAPPSPVTFETPLDRDRSNAPSYMASVAPDETALSPSGLYLYANYLANSGLREQLGKAAQAVLDELGEQGHVPPQPLVGGTKIDPVRLDVIRAYVLACSVNEAGKGPCKTDIAVRFRYDLNSGAVSEQEILHDIHDERRTLRLPDLPGR